jgi:hypothetical protein
VRSGDGGAAATHGWWIIAGGATGTHWLRLGFGGCGGFVAGDRRGGCGVAGGPVTDGDVAERRGTSAAGA